MNGKKVRFIRIREGVPTAESTPCGFGQCLREQRPETTVGCAVKAALKLSSESPSGFNWSGTAVSDRLLRQQKTFFVEEFVFDHLKEDIATVFARDPAARSTTEVLLCYPGVRALCWHRLSHRLYKSHHLLLARWVSAHAKRRTGI